MDEEAIINYVFIKYNIIYLNDKSLTRNNQNRILKKDKKKRKKANNVKKSLYSRVFVLTIRVIPYHIS